MLKRRVLLLLTLACAPAWSAATAEGVAQSARELRVQAKALRAQAKADYAAAEPACHARFLVYRCIEAAHQVRLERIRAARALDIAASRLELAEKQRMAGERAAKTASDREASASPGSD